MYYGYAVTVSPGFRAAGHLPAMHEAIFEEADKAGFCYALRPRRDALFKMYGGFGMQRPLTRKPRNFALTPPPKRPLGASRRGIYEAAKRALGSPPGIVRWDEKRSPTS
jgi:hypothetical protein